MLEAEDALQSEDRDVAEERKRVLECQPVVESMVGSPLILQELSKACDAFRSFFHTWLTYLGVSKHGFRLLTSLLWW